MTKIRFSDIPTWNQNHVLEILASGEPIIDGVDALGTQDIWFFREWTAKVSGRVYRDRHTWGMPVKLFRHRMSHMERYGWVVKIQDSPTESHWEITDEGRTANQQYEQFWKEYKEKEKARVN